MLMLSRLNFCCSYFFAVVDVDVVVVIVGIVVLFVDVVVVDVVAVVYVVANVGIGGLAAGQGKDAGVD